MSLSSLLRAPTFYCEDCRKDTKFLSINLAAKFSGVCRSTLYYWMQNGWIHWLEQPSSRRVICENSLRLRRSKLLQMNYPSKKDVRNHPKVSKTVNSVG